METIKSTIKSLKELSQEAIIKMEQLKDTTNIPELCKFYKDLTEGLELVEALVKSLKEIEGEISTKTLPDLLEATGVDSIKVHNRQFILTGRLLANMPLHMQEKGFKWLKEVGYGSIIKEGVNASTLSAAMKEYTENNGKLPPEDTMKIFIKKGVSVRKVR